MANNNIRDVAFDGATGRIRWGAVAMPCTKIDMPKESRKTEKIRYIGDTIARVRTAGVWDVDDGSIEMTSAVFAQLVLPHLPLHGGSLYEFPITVTQRHPLVTGPYSVVLDRCQFAGIEEAIENSEKATMTKIPISVIEVFRRGADGVWKSLAWRPSQGSLAAQALMF